MSRRARLSVGAGFSRLVCVSAVFCLFLLALACNRSVDDPLRPVSVPDLSRMSESVQQQIRDRYSSLTRKIETAGTPAADLANAYGDMGKLFMAAEYYDAAEPCYLNAHALAQSDTRWTYYLAHVYRHRNEMAKAAQFFERTLQLRSTDLPALVYLGEAYLAQGRPDAAEPPFAKAVSLEPRLALALFGLGRAALAKEDYASAVQYLEKALALEPRASTIHHPLAMAYRGLGQAEKAEAHLNQRGDVRASFLPDPLMFELDELLESPQFYELRGTQALNRAEWTAAAVYLRKAVTLAPNEPSAHLKLAEALRRTGLADEALLHYEHAVKVAPAGTDPRGPGARLGYAMVLVRLGRYQEARDRLSEAMKMHPDQPRLAHALVRLLAAAPDDRVRDGRRALAMVRQLLEKEPDDSDLVETMAMALAELQRFDEAVAWQRSLIAAATQAGHHDLVPGMAANLARYEARQPSRTAWTEITMP